MSIEKPSKKEPPSVPPESGNLDERQTRELADQIAQIERDKREKELEKIVGKFLKVVPKKRHQE